MSEGFKKLKRFHLMGGEPLYQKELDILLEMIEKHPNSDCEINLVTNLMVPKTRIVTVLEKFKQLLIARKIKRLDILNFLTKFIIINIFVIIKKINGKLVVNNVIRR